MHDVLWLKFGLQCSGIVWRHYYHHNLIMALYILCLWLCRYCTSAQPTTWGGTLADSSAWVPPNASNPIHVILDRREGENNHTTAPIVVHVTEKDDRIMTDHTGSYFMPIPPFFLLGSGANVTISALLKYALSFSLSSMFLKQNGATLATSRDRSPGRDRSNPSEWDIRQASVATEPPLPQYGHHSESFVSDRPAVKLITPFRSLRGRRDGVSKLSDGVGIPEMPVNNVQSKTVP